MSSGKLLLIFFIFTFIIQLYSRRLHFEDDVSSKSQTNNITEPTTEQNNLSTIQVNSTSITQTNTNIDEKTKKMTAQNKEYNIQQKPIFDSRTTSQTKTQTSTKTTGTELLETQNTEKQINPTKEITTQSNLSTVPLSNIPTLTTKQLTLNLSSLKFPDPKPQGDTLNLSGISIVTSSSSSTQKRCQSGYTISINGKNCQLADILLQINLDVQNLIIGNLNLEQLKAKQVQFKNKHQNFTSIQCSNQTPFLSKQGCIACKTPNSLFSLKSLKCSRCPEGSIFNNETKNCQSVPGIFVSNFNADKFLVLPGESLDDYKKQIQDLQKQNPNIQVCPLQKPYSIGAECVSCPNQKPLFFISSRSCTACQANSTYDANIHSCLGKKYKITTITKTSTKQEQKNKKQQDSSTSNDNKKKKKQQESSSSSDEKKKKKEENNENGQNDE